MSALLQWPALEQMRAKCDQVVSFGAGTFAWKEDDRYTAVLTQFGSERLDSVLTMLLRTLGSARAREDMTHAPPRIQKLVEYLGGLDRGQILFACDPGQGPILFCGWWPWGNGVTISIRIGLFDESATDEDRDAYRQLLHSWFSISPAT